MSKPQMPQPTEGLEGPKQISRRTFAKGCLAGSALFFPSTKVEVAALAAALPGTSPSKPMMVATMKGPVRCDSLGRTLMHEHILWFGGPRLEDAGYTPMPDDKRAESVEIAASLLNDAARVGINTLVDLTPHRPIDLYQQIAKRTSVKIVPSTGFYRRAKIPKQWADIEDEKRWKN